MKVKSTHNKAVGILKINFFSLHIFPLDLPQGKLAGRIVTYVLLGGRGSLKSFPFGINLFKTSGAV